MEQKASFYNTTNATVNPSKSQAKHLIFAFCSHAAVRCFDPSAEGSADHGKLKNLPESVSGFCHQLPGGFTSSFGVAARLSITGSGLSGAPGRVSGFWSRAQPAFCRAAGLPRGLGPSAGCWQGRGAAARGRGGLSRASEPV